MEKPKSSLRKPCQSVTWIDPGSNPDFCGKNLTTNGLDTWLQRKSLAASI